MNTTRQDVNQKICDGITQLQVDLEQASQRIFIQAGHRLQQERREAVEREIRGTNQLLERLKSRYI